MKFGWLKAILFSFFIISVSSQIVIGGGGSLIPSGGVGGSGPITVWVDSLCQPGTDWMPDDTGTCNPTNGWVNCSYADDLIVVREQTDVSTLTPSFDFYVMDENSVTFNVYLKYILNSGKVSFQQAQYFYTWYIDFIPFHQGYTTLYPEANDRSLCNSRAGLYADDSIPWRYMFNRMVVDENQCLTNSSLTDTRYNAWPSGQGSRWTASVYSNDTIKYQATFRIDELYKCGYDDFSATNLISTSDSTDAAVFYKGFVYINFLTPMDGYPSEVEGQLLSTANYLGQFLIALPRTSTTVYGAQDTVQISYVYAYVSVSVVYDPDVLANRLVVDIVTVTPPQIRGSGEVYGYNQLRISSNITTFVSGNYPSIGLIRQEEDFIYGLTNEEGNYHCIVDNQNFCWQEWELVSDPLPSGTTSINNKYYLFIDGMQTCQIDNVQNCIDSVLAPFTLQFSVDASSTGPIVVDLSGFDPSITLYNDATYTDALQRTYFSPNDVIYGVLDLNLYEFNLPNDYYSVAIDKAYVCFTYQYPPGFQTNFYGVNRTGCTQAETLRIADQDFVNIPEGFVFDFQGVTNYQFNTSSGNYVSQIRFSFALYNIITSDAVLSYLKNNYRQFMNLYLQLDSTLSLVSGGGSKHETADAGKFSVLLKLDNFVEQDSTVTQDLSFHQLYPFNVSVVSYSINVINQNSNSVNNEVVIGLGTGLGVVGLMCICLMGFMLWRIYLSTPRNDTEERKKRADKSVELSRAKKSSKKSSDKKVNSQV